MWIFSGVSFHAEGTENADSGMRMFQSETCWVWKAYYTFRWKCQEEDQSPLEPLEQELIKWAKVPPAQGKKSKRE